MERTQVVILREFNSPNEALIYKSLLESNGISCALFNELSSDVFAIQNESISVKLAVAVEDADLAEQLLEAKFDQEEFDTESVKRRKKP